MSKKKEKTRAELLIENKLLRRARTSETFATAFYHLISVGGAVWIAYYIYLSIAALAGKKTAADIGLNVLADVRISEAVAWIFGGGGIVYGMAQRRLRRKTTEHLQGEKRAGELVIDPRRSSSNLTPRGETRPEDKP